jgi:hypothetical protein
MATLALGAGLGLGARFYLWPPSRPQDGPPVGPERPPLVRATGAPDLRLRIVPWHFGTTAPGKEMKHRLEITNSTAEPWTLRHFNPTCSCTVGKLPSNTVKPGETASLEVTYRAPLREGRASARVMIEFAEPTSPVIQLEIHGEVRSLLSADPPSLELDYPSPGKPSSRTIALRNHSDRDVEITRVEAPEWLQTEVRPAAGPGKAWELIVHARPPKPHSAAETATLVVHTNSEGVGPALIDVRLKAPLTASPDQLAFGTVEVGKSVEKRIQLEVAPSLGELTEKDLVFTPPNWGDDLKARVEKQSSPRQFVLLVRFQPQRPLGALAGELEIKTRKGAAPPARVKVSGTAVSPGPPKR